MSLCEGAGLISAGTQQGQGSWANISDRFPLVSLQSQKRYHEDIFGAAFPYEVKKEGAARQPGNTKL